MTENITYPHTWVVIIDTNLLGVRHATRCFPGQIYLHDMPILIAQTKILRCWCSNPNGAKLFAINLPFTMKQNKVDNIAIFVYYG